MPIDYTRYPPNWKTEIRPAVLKRANNCCEFCGVENHSFVFRVKQKQRSIWLRTEDEVRAFYKKQPHMIGWSLENPIKVVLTIAHLDHDETNHNVSLDRLAALCQRCHLRYDAKEKYRRVMNK